MQKVLLTGFIFSTLLAFNSPSSAEGTGTAAPPQAGCPKAFQGFHLGGNIGYGVGSSRFKLSNSATRFNTSSTKGIRGVDGGIGVGYTRRLCNWALGIAFDANWAGTKGNHTLTSANSSSNYNARLKHSFQLYARMGYVFQEIAMPFIGLGWSTSQWKHNLSFRETTNGNTTFVGGNKSKYIGAFLWKAGVDLLATKQVVLGFEYTGFYGGHVRMTSKNVKTFNGSFKPQYNKFALTAKYVF